MSAISWQPQIKINGRWRGNGYRFETRNAARERAESVAARHARRGDNIGDVRAVETNDPVNQKDG
jgi:hypothetical protein